MLDSELLRRFYVTAQSKNLSHAAKKLNMVQSAVSTAIATLEAQLKTQLFVRTRGGLVVNAKGLELCEHVRKMEEETALFRKKFYEEDEKMEGELRIVTFPYIGSDFLIPLLKEFMDTYPKLRVHIQIEPENISPRNADVAIGSFIEEHPDLIQIELMPLELQLYAHKDYLERYGEPKKEKDLDHHRLVTYEDQTYHSPNRSTNLALISGVEGRIRQPNLSVSSLHGMLSAAMKGHGIAELPNFPSILDLGLKKVLPHLKRSSKNYSIYYITRQSKAIPNKIQKLHDYLREKLKKEES